MENTIDIRVRGSKGETSGKLPVLTWTRGQAFRRGGRRALKIVGGALLAILPFAFIDPFMAQVWGAVALVALLAIVGPTLHLRYSNELRSFERVDAPCPDCGFAGPLKPYATTAVSEEFVVLCVACGSALTVLAPRSETPTPH